MDATKAIQALASGDVSLLIQALGTDECTVIPVPGHTESGYITVARIGNYIVSAQGDIIQGGQFDDETSASGAYAELVADAQEWASEHSCPAPDAYAGNPLLADLATLLNTETIRPDMFEV